MNKKTTNEFFVRYLEDISNTQHILETSCKRWNEVATNQLRRKIKQLDDVEENDRTGAISFGVHFQNGSIAKFLLIPRNLSVFDLHSELRSSFQEDLKASTNISFNILGTDRELQSTLVDSLVSLVKLMDWEYPKYGKRAKAKKKEKKERKFGFYTDLDPTEVNEMSDRGSILADGTNLVRTLAVLPTNELDCESFIDIARSKKANSRYFIGKNKLKDLGYNSFLSVIRGDPESKGGIVCLKYKPRAAGSYPKIALIGKGIVFDTGGYSIKDSVSMENMHRDMTGAGVALATFEALSKLKVKAEIECYLAIADNLISESAYKPNEVVISGSGISIEIINTDCEGRMVLVDTMYHAQLENPNMMIDFATLTGAAPYAMDNKYACVFSNHGDMSRMAHVAGDESGERVWSFPIGGDFEEELESEIADVRQCQKTGNADHIYAATFLNRFVNKEVEWIHIDLSAENQTDGLGLVGTDVTGHGMRWAVHFVELWLENFKNR